MEQNDLVFNQGKSSELISFIVLSLGFVVLSAFLIKALTLGIGKLIGAFGILGGIYFAIIAELRKQIKFKNYSFIIKDDNTIIEMIGDEVIREINFAEIQGVNNLVSRKGINKYIEQDNESPIVSFYGVDNENQRLEFLPKYIPKLTKMFLKLKKRYPDIIIDEKFSRNVEIFRHKKIFGSYDPYTVFLLIVLLLGLVGLPLLMVIFFP